MGDHAGILGAVVFAFLTEIFLEVLEGIEGCFTLSGGVLERSRGVVVGGKVGGRGEGWGEGRFWGWRG